MYKRILFLEQTSKKFREMTKTSQVSGLGICIRHIAQSIPESMVMVVDRLDHIELAIQRFKPRKVVLENVTLLKRDAAISLKYKYPNTDFYMHLHSNIPFFSEEGFGFHRVDEIQRSGIKIIFNNKGASTAIDRSLYLPNIYKASEQKFSKKEPDQYLDVVCPGSVRSLKNIPMQLLCARQIAQELGKHLRFHFNSSRREGGDTAINSINGIKQLYRDITLVDIPWLEHEDFLKYLSNMDLGMQVSLTESFNMVTADMVHVGIPIVVSDTINWVHAASRVEPNNSEDIIHAANVALGNRYIIEDNQARLAYHSLQAVGMWRDFAQA